MALRHVRNVIAWLVVAGAVVGALHGVFGRRGAGGGVAVALTASLVLLIGGPRSAHRAFLAGRFGPAARRYRLLSRLAFTRTRERAATLSWAGALVALGRFDEASRVLGALDPERFDAAERVVWLNNRACVALEQGGAGDDALTLIDEATALRPDVPAVQHTRARALLAAGRVDDAIRVLEAMRGGGELSPRLEADRCHELAVAWERKGQAEYAADYRERARIFVGS